MSYGIIFLISKLSAYIDSFVADSIRNHQYRKLLIKTKDEPGISNFHIINDANH